MSLGKQPFTTDYNFTHVAAGTATTVVASPNTTSASSYPVLHTLTINTKGATANTITVYNNTAGSGDVIAIIDSTTTVGTLFFDVACPLGITCVSASGTGADYTVSWTK